MAQLLQTHNNPMNNSTSKQQYSFSNVDRFKERVKTEGADAMYDVPTTRDKKTFSFGKFKREHQFSHIKQNPPPGTYHVDGEVQKILRKKEGVKFMYSRDQIKSNNIFQASDVPGPGSYNPKPEHFEKSTSRLMTIGKAHTSKRLIYEAPLPGPGAYQVSDLILNENKILSNQKKSSYGKIIFPLGSSKRLKTEVNPELRLPQINNKGEKTIISDKGFTICKSLRFASKQTRDIPGPGAYNKFSEFIESKK